MAKKTEFKVSQSKIGTFLACRKKFEYRHVQHLKRRLPPNPLVRGRIVHAMIEEQCNGKDPWKAWTAAQKEYGKLFRQEREEYGDIPREIEMLMAGYFDWYKRDPLQYYEVDGRYAEHYFQVPLVDGIILEGTMDSLAHTRDKRFWLVEHKSHKQIPKGDIKYQDIQSVIYTHVMPLVGLPKPDGVLWNYIRMKTPTVPHLLKAKKDQKAEMSKAKIDTTWTVYEAALLDAKLDPKKYADMKKQLEGKEGDFYIRQPLPVNKIIQANVLEEVKAAALEMREQLESDKPGVRTIDNQCGWCEFYELCSAELRGLDSSIIRKQRYIEDKGDRYADQKSPLTPTRHPKTQGKKQRGA